MREAMLYSSPTDGCDCPDLGELRVRGRSEANGASKEMRPRCLSVAVTQKWIPNSRAARS
jgi:hypothetical protein